MSVIVDYHTHTFLCRHACGAPEDYVRAAAEKGIRYFGVSDHCPVPEFHDDWHILIDRFEEYIRIVEKLKENKYGVEVLLGLEIDWLPGKTDEITSFLSGYDFDYILGSVHYVDDFTVDNPELTCKWDSPERRIYVWNKYADLLKEMLESISIDIVGHLDLPKKYKMYPADMSGFYHKLDDVIRIAAGKDIPFEINTAGKRKPVNEFYPSSHILKAIRSAGGTITFGSDSHDPSEVGSGFDEAEKKAKDAGFEDYLIISQGGKKKKVKF